MTGVAAHHVPLMVVELARLFQDGAARGELADVMRTAARRKGRRVSGAAGLMESVGRLSVMVIFA